MALKTNQFFQLKELESKPRKLQVYSLRKQGPMGGDCFFFCLMILLWNVRGINDPKKQRTLKLRLKKHQCSIMCLLETHVRQDNSASIVAYLLPRWSFLANYEHFSMGRIWIFLILGSDWKSTHSQIKQCIAIVFPLSIKKYFLLYVIYGSNSAAERKSP